jgi:DNA-directed RNA polymerase specialized sigma24 family protein
VNPRFLRFLPPAEQAKAIADEHLFALLDDVVRITESRLTGRHIDLDRKDVEAAYNLAWAGVCQRIAQGGKVENLTGLLVDITYKRSLDIYRQRHEAMHTDDGLSDDVLESHAASSDLTEEVDDRGRLMGLFERLKERLNTNERKAITLCILHGYSRAEAAKVLGIPEPTFQRIIDAAWKKVAQVAAYLDGPGCGDGEWARALRSFAFGLIDENHRDYPRINEHVQGCESCRRYVQGLRGLAAVMPPLGLRFIPFAHHHVGLLHAAVRSVKRLFGGHGTAAASGSSGAGAAAGVGGTVKVAAVVVGLAIAGGVTIRAAAGHHHTPRHHHHAKLRPAVGALAAPIARTPVATNTPLHGRSQQNGTVVHRRAVYSLPSREQTHAIREFGIEQPHRATASRAATPKTATPRLASQPAVSQPQQVERGEFGFEKR